MTAQKPYITAYIARLLGGATAAALLSFAPAASAKDNSAAIGSALTRTLQLADGSRELRNAVDRLSRNPNDLDALIDAGNAALLLDDPQGAMGFFARAESLDPRNARAKAGLASAMLGNENPYEALRLFDEALKLGMVESFIAADRGLAYDLVGDNISAQRNYELALKRGGGDEVIRRYALSLGISGDRKQADRMLDPLLRKNDAAAWRTRAFILAINGEQKDAAAIASATMPTRLARAIQPFLDYMPKLTKPQQAAAAHFGHFPKTANIGRPDPRNAQYASASGARRGGADAGLIPAGEPLGANGRQQAAEEPKVSKERRRRPGRDRRASWRRGDEQPAETRRVAAAPPPAPAPSPKPAQIETASRPPAPAAAAETNTTVASSGQGSESLVEAVSAVSSAPVVIPEAPEGDADLAGAVASVKGDAETGTAPVQAQVAADNAANKPVPGFESLGNTAGRISSPAVQSVEQFDLAKSKAATSQPSVTEPSYVPSVPAPSGSQEATYTPSVPAPSGTASSVTETRNFAALMSEIEVPADELKRDRAAVDISKITPAKPTPKAAPAPPAAPKNPARHWVQISIGDDVSRLPFEWRRLSRKAPDLFNGKEGWTAPLGKTNRVLAGPFDSQDAAQDFVNELAKSDMGAFTWKSGDGEAVDKLPKK